MDYKKAFDTLNHSQLWSKLLAADVNGKILRVIVNMYEQAKSFVRVGRNYSELFPCKVGVRQGDNLSPLLFAIFLNDFSSFLRNKYPGLTDLKDMVQEVLSDDDIDVYLNIFCLLYADDTIIFAQSELDMQTSLNATEEYCKHWNLHINYKKTKVVVFSRGKIRKKPEFVVNGNKIEIVDSFCYLGVVFNYNGSFKKTITQNIAKANKALFSLAQLAKKSQLTIETRLELFERMIIPILTYGCEVWGYEGLEQLQVFQRKFIRKLLWLGNSTPNVMVLGEFGVTQIKYNIFRRMISFWDTLEKSSEKLSSTFWQLIKKGSGRDSLKNKWTDFVKNLVDTAGISYAWNRNDLVRKTDLHVFFKTLYNDWNRQEWEQMRRENLQLRHITSIKSPITSNTT